MLTLMLSDQPSKQYNEKMGGVNLSDLMITYYRMCARTKKWTVHTILHMLDLCLGPGEAGKNRRRQKELIEFLDFSLVVSENLLFCGDMSEDKDNLVLIPGDEAPPKQIALPVEVAQKHKAAHMPQMSEMKKCRAICTTCKSLVQNWQISCDLHNMQSFFMYW